MHAPKLEDRGLLVQYALIAADGSVAGTAVVRAAARISAAQRMGVFERRSVMSLSPLGRTFESYRPIASKSWYHPATMRTAGSRRG